MSNSIYDIVCPGDRVDIQSVSEIVNSNDEEAKYYISKVYDVFDDDTVSILMPMEKFKMILLNVGEEFDLFFYTKKGIYTCKGHITERNKDDNVYVAVFSPVTDLTKRQRREYYRYDCIIGMNSRKLRGDECDRYMEYKDTSFLQEPNDKSVIVDISGGGLRFVSADKYETGDMVLCKFILNFNEHSKMFDVVLRILSLYPVVNNPKNTEYRGQFVFLEERIRDEIVKYIFEEERKTRKRF